MSNATVPIRAVTSGPKFHWFGYYDKLQFDPAGRYLLGMEVDFEHRSPTGQDVIKIGMVDLRDGDRWIELGDSRAWCWQQGCMLQWLPGSPSEIVWNDRQGDQFVCHVMDVQTHRRRTLPGPVYTLSPDGRWALSPDFRRINHTRPGYGYAGLHDPNRDVPAPRDSGIWRMDMRTGRRELIVSLAQMLDIPLPQGDLSQATHWFNHLLWNTDGSRFEFLHRWRMPGGKGLSTRMLTADGDGSNIHVINDSGMVSHFIWRDPKHILAWSMHPTCGKAFYLYEDRTGNVQPVGKDLMTADGHVSYLPGCDWILNDSYPDKDRIQPLYLYHVSGNRKVPLGGFHQPPEYRQPSTEWRCDLHPRASPDGRSVVIDSVHEGKGRQMYLLDISGGV